MENTKYIYTAQELFNKNLVELKKICKENKIPNYSKCNKNEIIEKILEFYEKYNNIANINENLIEYFKDNYDEYILRSRFINFKNMYMNDEQLIINGLNIRHQNTPEDITENITKFIIINYEKDMSCVWCKGVDKKYCLTGDLYSNKYEKSMPIEVKSFTSNGPSQFGPNKKFGVIYFLDLRKWLNNVIILWKVNLNYLSNEFNNIKVNKYQTMGDQLKEGRRPHISWDNIYPQIINFCEKIYEGTFENIFT
jgi:hypothetical protein